MAISDRRIRLGRVQIYIEPRDIWVGVYVAPGATYLCPFPLVVIRWDRHRRATGSNSNDQDQKGRRA